MLVDRRGVPLSSVITEANKHDRKSAFPTMDSIVVDRPKVKQNICMDKGYDFPEIEYGVRIRGYVDHIRRKGEVLKKNLYKAKRWVVERTASWHNRFRKLLVRFEKKKENYQTKSSVGILSIFSEESMSICHDLLYATIIPIGAYN